MSRIFVDIVTATWGRAEDLRLLELPDELLEELNEDDLVRLATAHGEEV